MRAVDEAYNLVLLEGPAEVEAASRAVLTSIGAERVDQRRLRDEPDEATGPLRDRHRERWLAAIELRTNHRLSFLDAVRPALNNA